MKIYYLYNSGFTIELGADALIVDYCGGKLDRPWRTPVPNDPAGYGDIYALASHAHGDHYSAKIFDWLSERGDIRYILSDDIKAPGPALKKTTGSGRPAAFIGEGERLRSGNLDIRAYGSTDQGVSFHITAEDGTSLFHAGDLNYWHWRDESTPDEIEEALSLFTDKLSAIKKGIGKLDVAFFPVDPRLGSDYYRGAVMFCEALKPALLVPMHFAAAALPAAVFSPPEPFLNEVTRYTRVAGVGPGPGVIKI